MSHAHTWRTRNRHLQRECPTGIPEDVWHDVTARFRAYGDAALRLVRLHGPMTSREIASELCPGMNAGRMGEVMKILHRAGHIKRDGKHWTT